MRVLNYLTGSTTEWGNGDDSDRNERGPEIYDLVPAREKDPPRSRPPWYKERNTLIVRRQCLVFSTTRLLSLLFVSLITDPT